MVLVLESWYLDAPLFVFGFFCGLLHMLSRYGFTVLYSQYSVRGFTERVRVARVRGLTTNVT